MKPITSHLFVPSMLPLRMQRKILVDERTGCWLWIGARTDLGYGRVRRHYAQPLVHRLVYQLLVGPIEAETLDHLCRVRHCCNPIHLEPVSNRENILRGEGLSARNARKTHCKRGHELDGPNLIRYRNIRWCRTCREASRKERYWREKPFRKPWRKKKESTNVA